MLEAGQLYGPLSKGSNNPAAGEAEADTHTGKDMAHDDTASAAATAEERSKPVAALPAR